MQFRGFFFIRKWKLFTCTLLLHDGLRDHFSDSFIMTLLTSFIYRNYDKLECDLSKAVNPLALLCRGAHKVYVCLHTLQNILKHLQEYDIKFMIGR